MRHSRIFFCTCTRTGCYVKGSSFSLAHRGDATLKDHKGSSLALAHRRDATLKDLPFEFAHKGDATLKEHKGSSLALAHRRDATLKDLLLHLHTDGMLHWRIFFRTCTQRGGYVKRIFFLHLHTDGIFRPNVPK